MDEDEFRAAVSRLEEVSAAVGKLDPAIRSQAFALLSGYVSASTREGALSPGLGAAATTVGEGDIDALVFATLIDAAKSAQEDLRAIMEGVQRITAAKQRMRDLIQKVCEDIAANAGIEAHDQISFAPNGLGGEDAYHHVPLPAHEPGCPGALAVVATDLYPGTTLTDVQQLREIRDSLKTRLDGMSELSDMDQLRLQMAMDRRSKLISTLSNVLKKASDTQQAITQNLK